MTIESLYEVPELPLDPGKKEFVIAFLRVMPAPPRRKKIWYIEWIRAVGLELLHEDVQAVLGTNEPRAR